MSFTSTKMLPEVYETIQEIDVESAFRLARSDIKEAQEHLRRIAPESPLLSLVTVSENRLDFSDEYGPFIRQYLPKEENTSKTPYWGMGRYVQLLFEEAMNIQYPQRAKRESPVEASS